MQLRFASFAVINLREDLHLQECARAGRTKKNSPPTCAGGLNIQMETLSDFNQQRQALRTPLPLDGGF